MLGQPLFYPGFIKWVRKAVSIFVGLSVLGFLFAVAIPTKTGVLIAVVFSAAGMVVGILWASRTALLGEKAAIERNLPNAVAYIPTDSPIGFKTRPEYGGTNLLIEFLIPEDPEKLFNDLVSLLEHNGFEINQQAFTHYDAWEYPFTSSYGAVLLSKGEWDVIYITGAESQEAIMKIDALLQESPSFEKIETNPAHYLTLP